MAQGLCHVSAMLDSLEFRALAIYAGKVSIQMSQGYQHVLIVLLDFTMHIEALQRALCVRKAHIQQN